MRIIVRTALFMLMLSFAYAGADNSPTLWQSIKKYWMAPHSSSEEKQEVKADAPSLGVWGTINRFFQSKTSTYQPTFKTPSVPPEKQESSDKIESQEVTYSYKEIIVPHKARYVITLEKNYGDDISDAAGEMTINVYDTGDGLVFEQNSSLVIYNGDGEGEQIITNLATWQDYEGKRYRFNSRTVRDGEQEEIIKGEAIKNNQEKVTRITYSRPTTSQITTPYETIFPLHHLIHSLAMAKAGKSVVSNVVFDGSSETHEAVTVDTILGAPRPSELKIKTDQDILIKNQWPMRLAVYAPESDNSDPDYEMVQNVLDSGVIKDMTLDYGAFQVKATLDKIDFYESSKSG